MVSSADVISKAREYLGTPFHHQGRVKGVGIDCAGLVVEVARELGLGIHDCAGYSRYADGVSLQQELERSLDVIPHDMAGPGDVVCLWIRRQQHPCHIGILTDRGLIHTYANVGRVVEHTFDERWQSRVHSTYRFRGVG